MLTQEHSGVAPRLLDDLDVWQFYPRSSSAEEVYIVGSITADRYLTVPGSKLPAVRAFIGQLDGRLSLDEARERMIREHGVEMDVDALYRKFKRAGLVAAQSDRQQGDLEASSAELLRLPIDRLLRALGWLSPLGRLVAYIGLSLIAAVLFLAVFDPAFRQIAASPLGARFSLDGGVAVAIVIGTVSIVVHELSHVYAASCWGIASGTLKVQLYLGVIPIVGLKLAGLYTLPPHGRLAVWSAGVFFNLTAAAAALLALRTVAPGSAFLQTAAAFNWILVVFNLMPLLPTDGYFLLSTLVRDSNVRVRAWDWLRRPFHPKLRRPSLFVLAYILATVWLLSSTLLRLAAGIAASGSPLWRSALSAGLLILFLVTLWRAFRLREGSE
jgi:Zn-dependent protease